MNPAASPRAAWRGLPLLLTALTACEQVIEPDLPDHTPRLVLQAFFTADSSWSAYVGRSAGILEPLPPGERAVAGASVELLDGDHVVEKLRFLEWPPIYVLDENPLEAGRSYSLRVSAPGFATIRATDAVPLPVAASAEPYVSRADVVSHAIRVEIQDPPGETNYYQVSIHSYDRSGRREWSFSTRDPSIMGRGDSEGSPIEEEGWHGSAPFFKDTLFDGRTHRIELIKLTSDSAYSDRIHLQVLHISETYYEYLKTAHIHDETADNPFAEPLGVHGNVENGYGIFAGYSSRTFEFDFDSDFDFE